MKKFYYTVDHGKLELYDGKCDNARDIVLDIADGMYVDRGIGLCVCEIPEIEVFNENKENLGVFETGHILNDTFYHELPKREE